MSDLERARSLEEGRYRKALTQLDAQHELRISRIDAEMSRRGLQHTDARLRVVLEARLEHLNAAIANRVAIRREMIRSCPELGSPPELNHLAGLILEDVTNLQAECQKCGPIMAPEIFDGLLARAREGIDDLKRETSLQLRLRPKPPAIFADKHHVPAAAVGAGFLRTTAPARPTATAAGAALNSFDAIYRKVQETIGDLEGRNLKLAAGLRQLAGAIRESAKLGDERSIYLEQVQFLAEQAARAAVLRRIGVVKGILVSLRSGLNNVPDVAPAWRAASPLLVSHFGIKWLSI